MFPSMLLFGFAGVVAKAADHAGYISLNPEAAYEAMFLLLAKLPDIWLGVVVFMVIGLVTSTADTIQTGLAATITGELTNRQLSLNWARIFSLAVRKFYYQLILLLYDLYLLLCVVSAVECSRCTSSGIQSTLHSCSHDGCQHPHCSGKYFGTSIILVDLGDRVYFVFPSIHPSAFKFILIIHLIYPVRSSLLSCLDFQNE